jgi:hypothetical protein
MKVRTLLTSIALMLASTDSAFAQATLGELLDAGGKKLTKDEVTSTVSGKTVTGMNTLGGEMRVDYNADGAMMGSGKNPQGRGREYPISGKWWVDETGKWCTDFRTPAGPNSTCSYLFKNGDEYFLSGSPSDRSVRVVKRTISK